MQVGADRSDKGAGLIGDLGVYVRIRLHHCPIGLNSWGKLHLALTCTYRSEAVIWDSS